MRTVVRDAERKVQERAAKQSKSLDDTVEHLHNHVKHMEDMVLTRLTRLESYATESRDSAERKTTELADNLEGK